MAFSQPPVLLNGTVAIVVAAHLTLISAFTYGNVSAGLARLGPEFEQMAESLGARPAYRLRRVTLPLVTPYMIAAFSLSFALSMGELGATVMVYPPGWVTLPVGIFALRIAATSSRAPRSRSFWPPPRSRCSSACRTSRPRPRCADRRRRAATRRSPLR